jgi:hypothetical protein
MQHLIDDVRCALKAQSWNAALALALAMPDVCGYLETPAERSSERRYVRWFKQNLEIAFTYDRRHVIPFPYPGSSAPAIRSTFPASRMTSGGCS